MKTGKTLVARIAFVAVLLAICAWMMVIGRGHTVYFDTSTLEYNGVSYKAPYRVNVYIKGERVAKLAARERGMTTHIGQDFSMALGVIQEKNGEEQFIEVTQPLPYGMDGVIINLPGYLAGLPEEVYLTEFISSEPPAEEPAETPSEEEGLLPDAEF